MADCRECCDPIVFVQLDTGKRIPCNPIPNERGNVAARVIGHNLHGFVITADKQPGPFYTFRMLPHFATCTERKGPEPAKPVPDDPLF